MATQSLSRTLFSKPTKALTSISLLFSRSFTSSCSSLTKSPTSLLASSFINRARPMAAVLSAGIRGVGPRALSTRATSSSLNDPNPNWSNRPPKETILLDGCDFEHWLVVMEKPEGDPTRDEIIDSYIKTLAMVVGSEDEARKKIYSVSTRCYYAFGALVSEELSYKIKELPRVRWVLPDSYLDVKNKDYGGEPFIDGKAVPYDPKYHEEWIRNNARATERNRRNDRPRNFDRSRNFERRRENMRAHQDFNNREMPPMSNQGMQNPGPNMGGMPPPNMGGMPPPNNMGGMPPPNNMGGMPPPNNMGGNNMGGMPPPNNMGGMPPPNNMGGMPPPNNIGGMPPPNNMGGNNMGGMPPPNNMGGMPPPNNMGGRPPSMAPNNMGGMPPNNMGGMHRNNVSGMPPHAGWSGNMHQNYQPNSGGMPYQGQDAGQNPQYQNNYNPNRDGGNMPGGNPYQG